MRVRKVKIKLFGHSGIKTGARLVQGATFFDNRLRYILQSQRTTKGKAAELPTLEEIEGEKYRLYRSNASRIGAINTESRICAGFIARQALFRPKIISSQAGQYIQRGA